MGGVDLVILNSGIGGGNLKFDWEKDKAVIETNVLGFVAMADVATSQFIKQNSGHLVGVSSISAVRGLGLFHTYSASKAFISTYLAGLRHAFFLRKLSIDVTDVKPGYVETAINEGQKGKFWTASPEVAAQQIWSAIKKKKKHVYVTRRWAIVAFFMQFLPDWILYSATKR